MSSQNRRAVCPLLGTHDAVHGPAPALIYPSFEHCCFALSQIPDRDLATLNADPLLDGPQGEQLLLADQATFCLNDSYRLCPRYRYLRGDEPVPPLVLPPGAEGLAYAGLSTADVIDGDLEDEPSRLRGSRFNVWMGAATLLLVFLICGGSFAAYAGWRLVDRSMSALSPQPSDAARDVAATTLNTAPLRIQLATATPQSLSLSSVLPTAAIQQPPQNVGAAATPTPQPDASAAAFSFPQAVTPTPTTDSGLVPLVISTPTSSAGAAPAASAPEPAPPLATAVAGPAPVVAGGIATPTRRPTPLPGQTALLPDGQPVLIVTATPTPDLPEPIVSFRSAHEQILPGDCTILYWEVENARAVYLDGMGVAGSGQERVCQRWESQTYTLDVLSLSGEQETYRLEVLLVPHTATPTITPTETPVLTPTPTWTPDGAPPPATPEPARHEVALAVDGGNQKTCAPGAMCETVLQLENRGSLADEIFIDLGSGGGWTARICSPDGPCAETSLSVGVGPGARRPLYLRVDVPADAAGQSQVYQISAASGNSNRTQYADPVLVTIFAGSP